jgi:hypothetical protein
MESNVKSDFTFKYLEIPGYENVVKELELFYNKIKDNQVFRTKNKDNASIMQLNLDSSALVEGVGNLTRYTFVHLDPITTMQHLPSLAKYFASTKLGELARIAIVTTHPMQTQDPHIDQGNETLGINFPLSGNSATYTSIFKNKGRVEYVVSQDEVKPGIKEQRRYLKYIDENPEEIARYELTRPVMLNVKMPHSVVNLSKDERVGISFRFKQDPWSLIV